MPSILEVVVKFFLFAPNSEILSKIPRHSFALTPSCPDHFLLSAPCLPGEGNRSNQRLRLFLAVAMNCNIAGVEIPVPNTSILFFLSPKPPFFFASSLLHPPKPSKTPHSSNLKTRSSSSTYAQAAGVEAAVSDEEQDDIRVAEGYTITQFCDKVIDLFLNQKPKSKDWRKYLVFREEWNKYSDRFYNRCRVRGEVEADPLLRQKITSLGRKVRKIDEEMERHTDLLKEIQENPTDINSIVTKRRRDFTGEFFHHLTLLSETFDSVEDRDATARLGARCLSAVSAYDKTLEIVDTFDTAQEKFNDILNAPSLDAACEKIKSLAKAKQLDSSLILLINRAWASAKESTTMKNEVKEIMYKLYKTTKSSLRSITPKEIKLLKHLLNIVDPEDRFSALATAFSPGSDHEAKDPNALYTTPKELHKWIKIMLDAYHNNKEDSDIREAKQMTQPVVIQRLFILKETIEEEYMDRDAKGDADHKPDDD